MIQAVLLIVGVLVGISFGVALLVAAAVSMWSPAPEQALQWIGNGHTALAGLMPVALWFALAQLRARSDHDAAYAGALRAVLTAIQGALIGSILGAGPVFMTVVIRVPAMLAGYDVDTLSEAVREEIVWSRLALAASAATISAIPLGWWGYYRGGDQDVR